MHGMILAAGRGERMRELTHKVPKPLVRVGEHYLIEYAIQSFVNAGIKNIVINVCYLGNQIIAALGKGEKYGVNITYSQEKVALETGGGVFQALPFLGKKSFVVMSADVITDYPLENLFSYNKSLAHLVLVNNPSFNPQGDFSLVDNKVVIEKNNPFTFASFGSYSHELFAESVAGKFRLMSLLDKAIANKQVTGEYFQGLWHNVGSPEDLAAITKLPEIIF